MIDIQLVVFEPPGLAILHLDTFRKEKDIELRNAARLTLRTVGGVNNTGPLVVDLNATPLVLHTIKRRGGLCPLSPQVMGSENPDRPIIQRADSVSEDASPLDQLREIIFLSMAVEAHIYGEICCHTPENKHLSNITNLRPARLPQGAVWSR